MSSEKIDNENVKVTVTENDDKKDLEVISPARTMDAGTAAATAAAVAAAAKEIEMETTKVKASPVTVSDGADATDSGVVVAVGGGAGAGGVDIQAADPPKIKSNDNDKTDFKNTKNNLVLKSDAIIANGENNGNVVKGIQSPTLTSTTEITTKATITPALDIPMKQQQQKQQQQRQQQEQRITGGAANPQGDESTTKKGKMENDAAALINFKVLFIVTQLCGVTMIALVGSWVGVHLGGVAGTDNPRIEFNWHPLLMTIGLIFLYGNSILVYRGFRTARKKALKITHASIHMAAFVLTVIALKTVFDSHNLVVNPIPNMYSLHSWLGLSAVLIFCMQYVCGFMAYMVPGLKERYKIAYMPLHIYFGLFGFVLAIAAALMGFTEKAIFSLKNYSELPSAGVLVNLCGVLFVVFGALVVYLCTEPSYKRKPIPEDAVLLTGANE